MGTQEKKKSIRDKCKMQDAGSRKIEKGKLITH